MADNPAIIDTDDGAAISDFENRYGEWGTEYLVLTREHLSALLSGKSVLSGDGEYTTVISIEDEE